MSYSTENKDYFRTYQQKYQAEVLDKALGMKYTQARNILNKDIFFMLIQKSGMDICFKCGKRIENKEELSIEHKTAWLTSDNPNKNYFDLDNIAFSHRKCNTRNYSRQQILKVNKTGFKGVQPRGNSFRAVAVIPPNKTPKHFGTRKTAREAAILYDQEIVKYKPDAVTNKMLGLLD